MYLDKQLAVEQHPRHQYTYGVFNLFYKFFFSLQHYWGGSPSRISQFRSFSHEHMNFRGTLIQLGSPRPLSINFSKHETHSRLCFAKKLLFSASSGKSLNRAVESSTWLLGGCCLCCLWQCHAPVSKKTAKKIQHTQQLKNFSQNWHWHTWRNSKKKEHYNIAHTPEWRVVNREGHRRRRLLLLLVAGCWLLLSWLVCQSALETCQQFNWENANYIAAGAANEVAQRILARAWKRVMCYLPCSTDIA